MRMIDGIKLVEGWDDAHDLPDDEIARRLAKEIEDYRLSLSEEEDRRFNRPLKIVCPDCDGRHLRYPSMSCRVLAEYLTTPPLA
jgi:hypothetical protein